MAQCAQKQNLRTCVSCRAKDERSRLLRLKVSEGELVADAAGKLPGRGAWVHPQAACINKLSDLRIAARAFRQEVRSADITHIVS